MQYILQLCFQAVSPCTSSFFPAVPRVNSHHISSAVCTVCTVSAFPSVTAKQSHHSNTHSDAHSDAQHPAIVSPPNTPSGQHLLQTRVFPPYVPARASQQLPTGSPPASHCTTASHRPSVPHPPPIHADPYALIARSNIPNHNRSKSRPSPTRPSFHPDLPTDRPSFVLAPPLFIPSRANPQRTVQVHPPHIIPTPPPCTHSPSITLPNLPPHHTLPPHTGVSMLIPSVAPITCHIPPVLPP